MSHPLEPALPLWSLPHSFWGLPHPLRARLTPLETASPCPRACHDLAVSDWLPSVLCFLEIASAHIYRSACLIITAQRLTARDSLKGWRVVCTHIVAALGTRVETE